MELSEEIKNKLQKCHDENLSYILGKLDGYELIDGSFSLIYYDAVIHKPIRCKILEHNSILGDFGSIINVSSYTHNIGLIIKFIKFINNFDKNSIIQTIMIYINCDKSSNKYYSCEIII